MIKKTRDTTALVKDLELQLDYLIGYSPTGTHWKREYHTRENFINETINDESTPQEVRDKIFRIQDTLYKLRNGEKHKQGYVYYSQLAYMEPKETHQILVNEMGVRSYYI